MRAPLLAAGGAAALAVVAGAVWWATEDERAPVPFEGEPPACESPRALTGDTGPEALAERVVRELFGEPARALATSASVHVARVQLETVTGATVVADVLVDPPCLRGLASPELALAGDGTLTSEVAGTVEVRLHDEDVRFSEVVRQGVAIAPGEPVALALPEGTWVDVAVAVDDGRVLRLFGPSGAPGLEQGGADDGE